MLVLIYQTARRNAVEGRNIYPLLPVHKMLKKVKFEVLKGGEIIFVLNKLLLNPYFRFPNRRLLCVYY